MNRPPIEEIRESREPGWKLDDQIIALCDYALFLEARTEEQEARAEELESALEFYGDPLTYFAIGFFPDPPAGDFMHDFEETDFGRKPGKLARQALKQE